MSHNVGDDQTGADLIAAFVAQHCSPSVHLVTGGACAFIVDALGRHPEADYVCFQHEQAAAMAADAVWRVKGKVGVTLATSGPGATNLVTGIACSWFDSIPSLHITGQVNDSESRDALGAQVRQAGFQETDIVSMVMPITKFATRVHSVEELVSSLSEGLQTAISGRMGPVLIDVPMNVQKEYVPRNLWDQALQPIPRRASPRWLDWTVVSSFLGDAKRPLVIIGGGAALAGTAADIQRWCESEGIPYVSSWSGLPSLRPNGLLYQGSLGVYGSPVANWTVQASDKVLALGTRLDNRQRSGNPRAFAPFSQVLVIDIDDQELAKFRHESNYQTSLADLGSWPEVSQPLGQTTAWQEWRQNLQEVGPKIPDGTKESVALGELNPYDAVQEIQKYISPNAIVVADCGANLCWVYQSFAPSNLRLFTAAGNSPMGYSLPAAIGAKIAEPQTPVWCFIGDGGLQMNIQELQTIAHYRLNITIIILNNHGYGIIKQFQDAYFDGRHEASGSGYSVPDFERLAEAYGIRYHAIHALDEILPNLNSSVPSIVDVFLPEGAQITPKLELDRFLHDQFPYATPSEVAELMPVPYPPRPSLLAD